MTKIAQYGMNGKVGQNGKVLFNIEQGPMVEGMDDPREVLKQRYPELYKEIEEADDELHTVNQEYMKHKTASAKKRLSEIGGKLIELWRQAREFLYSPDKSGISPMEQSHIAHNNWSRRMAETKLSEVFEKSDCSTQETFLKSIMEKNASGNIFDSDFLNEDLKKFYDLVNKKE